MLILYLGIAIAIWIVLARIAIKVIKWSWPYLRDIALSLIVLFIGVIIWLYFKKNPWEFIEDLVWIVITVILIYWVMALINYMTYENPKLTKIQQKEYQKKAEMKVLKIFLIGLGSFLWICIVIACVATYL